MQLRCDIPSLQIVQLQYLQDDPSRLHHKIFSSPVPLTTGAKLYIHTTGTVLVTADQITFMQDDKLRLLYAPALAQGSTIAMLVDSEGSYGLDFVDRTPVDGKAVAYNELVVTNDSDVYEYANVNLVSEDLDSSFHDGYPVQVNGISFAAGVPSQAYINYGLPPGTDWSDTCVFFNNLYVGQALNGAGHLDADFTSAKSGRVIPVRRGKLQFALLGDTTWTDVYTIPRLYPGEQRSVGVRCELSLAGATRFLNSVRVLATEEIT